MGEPECSSRFRVPGEAPPLQASDYNGYALPDVCFGPEASKNVYVVGDWGGILFKADMPPLPADKRSKMFASFHRTFVWGVDDRAQLLVAQQMRKRAEWAPPEYILNVGDNFYWGGVDGHCGSPPFTNQASEQWKHVFENVYWGPGLDGKSWLGVLGNHDYGGYHFKAAWDNTIGYSWGQGQESTGRWMTPAQYFSSKVNYDTFSIDYYFIDSNVNEAWTPDVNPSHNICGLAHNGEDATCGPQGPQSVHDCYDWFHRLWEEQLRWLEDRLDHSTANWQVIVTHFPPKWAGGEWECFADRYGVDVHISGHVHYQQITQPWDGNNPIKGTLVLVSGGGGGITSESPPDEYGDDDAYGFMHLTLSKDEIKAETISHAGHVRAAATQKARWPNKNRPRCSGAGPPEHFVAVDGGKDRACRGKDPHDEIGTNFLLMENVPTADSCMRHCRSTVQCKGIEYGNKVCAVWTVDITTSVNVKGFSCLKFVPGPGADAPALASNSTWSSAILTQFGEGYECRSPSDEHREWADFRRSTAPTVLGCEKLCLGMGSCKGYEYGPGTTCNLWQVPIQGSSPKTGVTCVPNQVADLSGAGVVEIGGLLHV